MSKIKSIFVGLVVVVGLMGSVGFSAEMDSKVECCVAKPLLYKKIAVPESLLAKSEFKEETIFYGGDVRVADLDGDGEVEFVVFRCGGDGTKPCFIAGFDMDGKVLWQDGDGGRQPIRPGAVAGFDIDGDGECEVINFFEDKKIKAAANSMANVVIQIRDGKTGKVELQKHPKIFDGISGEGANWVHHRIFIAKLGGSDKGSDFVCKLGSKVVAFNNKLELLFSYDIKWNEYSKCSAYIVSVGDIDGDGKDEINGGYYLLDDDGKVMWEKRLGRNMDSVAIAEWDDGKMRAICSGGGYVMDEKGSAVMELGATMVPHGQEVRVARFKDGDKRPQMVIRYRGHETACMVVDTCGKVINRFNLNYSPNNTGMEAVYFNGVDKGALLYNGGMLWDVVEGISVKLPGLSKPVGPARMGWYHCIAGDVCGDGREEVVVYNPWDKFIWIYTQRPLDESKFKKYVPGARQYNCRLMD